MSLDYRDKVDKEVLDRRKCRRPGPGWDPLGQFYEVEWTVPGIDPRKQAGSVESAGSTLDQAEGYGMPGSGVALDREEFEFRRGSGYGLLEVLTGASVPRERLREGTGAEIRRPGRWWLKEGQKSG